MEMGVLVDPAMPGLAWHYFRPKKIGWSKRWAFDDEISDLFFCFCLAAWMAILPLGGTLSRRVTTENRWKKKLYSYYFSRIPRNQVWRSTLGNSAELTSITAFVGVDPGHDVGDGSFDDGGGDGTWYEDRSLAYLDWGEAGFRWACERSVARAMWKPQTMHLQAMGYADIYATMVFGGIIYNRLSGYVDDTSINMSRSLCIIQRRKDNLCMGWASDYWAVRKTLMQDLNLAVLRYAYILLDNLPRGQYSLPLHQVQISSSCRINDIMFGSKMSQ